MNNSPIAHINETRWCSEHPTAFWGKDQWGNFYSRCSIGNKLNQKCEVGKDEEGGKNENV